MTENRIDTEEDAVALSAVPDAPATDASAEATAMATVGSGAATAPAPIRVHVPAFEGPLDLLLHLIQQQEIDIKDIPIAKITRQYLETLELMRELDLEVAGEFLVMAATLMRIKARMLLPPAITEEEEEDPRQALVRQLVEYSRFKEAAVDLARLEADRRLLFDRGAPAELEDPQASELLPVSMFRLLDALKAVLSRQVPPIVHTLNAETMSLEEAMALMKSRFLTRPRLLFEEVLESFVTRLEKITAFLGLLELLKQGRVIAAQEALFGPIWIEWRDENAPEPARIEEVDA